MFFTLPVSTINLPLFYIAKLCELEREHVRWGISALRISLRRGHVFRDVHCQMPTTSVSYYEFTYVSVALVLFFGDFFPQDLYSIITSLPVKVTVQVQELGLVTLHSCINYITRTLVQRVK